MVAIKIWAPKCKGKRLLILSDNTAAIAVINKGKSKDSNMLRCLREITYFAATYGLQIKANHIRSEDNVLPDLLSRIPLSQKYKVAFLAEVDKKDYVRIQATEEAKAFDNVW